MENAEEEAEKSCPGFQQLLACVLLKPEAEEASFHSIPSHSHPNIPKRRTANSRTYAANMWREGATSKSPWIS